MMQNTDVEEEKPFEISVGVLTVSDRCAAKLTEDTSSKTLISAIKGGLLQNARIAWSDVVPDLTEMIQFQIKFAADVLKLNVLLTTGGTGLSPRDLTPDSTLPLLDRTLDAFFQLQLIEGLKHTPMAALSRAVNGVRNETLIINLPGSAKGALENFKAVVHLIPHAVDLILDRRSCVDQVHHGLNSHCHSQVKISERERFRIRESQFPMLPFEKVIPTLKQEVERLPEIDISIAAARGYVLAEDVLAQESLPNTNASIKDGYAVAEYHTKYKVIGSSYLGSCCEIEVKGDEAVRVSTGSALPKGTNCVIPVEMTSVAFDPNMEIIVINPEFIFSEVDIRKVGDDLQAGSVVLREGTTLQAAEISVLAAVGKSQVKVIRKPVVAVLSTGDELINFDEPMAEGKIRDSNRLLIIELLKSFGLENIVDLGIVPDSPEDILHALHQGLATADVIITSGGMSMGVKDLMKSIFVSDLNTTIHFGRLEMKPGKPTAFGSLRYDGTKKYWFGLPGNPASAFVTFHVVVLPGLKIMMNRKNCDYGTLMAVLGESVGIKRDAERVDLQRGIMQFDHTSRDIVVISTEARHQHSSRILNCSNANCLIEIPKGSGVVEPGSYVKIILLK